jgi:hypothetical protein
MALALPAGTVLYGANLAAAAVQWILCAGSLILLAPFNCDMQKRLPGIGSLFRKSS